MFDGLGIGEMVEQYEEECTSIHNQRGDNRTVANVRGAVARRGSGLSADQKLYPGVILFVSDPKDVLPFQLGEVYPSSQADEQLTIRLAEQRVGINDVNQGQITPPIGRATATTVMAQLQEGTRRFDLNTSELRKGMGEQAIQICELYQTHGLPAPDEANSPEQVLDPQDAILTRQVIEQTDQIRGLVALKLNISTAAVNKEIEKQSSIQLFQMVMGYYQQILQLMPMMFQPGVPPQMIEMVQKVISGADKMMKQVFQSHQRFDLEDVLLGMGGEDGSGPDGLMGAISGAQQAVGGPAGGANGAGGLQAPGLGGLLGMSGQNSPT